jgi:predicted DNA-binding transcriptional regulator AlpA
LKKIEAVDRTSLTLEVQMRERRDDRINQVTWDREELARVLSLSTRTITRLSAQGMIPRPVRIGGSLRWRAKDVIDFLEKLPTK